MEQDEQFYKGIAAQVKQLKLRSGFTQAKLRRLDIVDPAVIDRIISGQTKPTVATLRRIAELYKVDVEIKFIKHKNK